MFRNTHLIGVVSSFLVIVSVPCSHCFAEERYVNYTSADSSRLQGFSIGDFVWGEKSEIHNRLLTPTLGVRKATLLLLHGAGDNGENFSKIAARIDSAEIEHVIPQGPFEATVHMEDPANGQLAAFRGFSWISSTGSWPDGGAGLSFHLIDKLIEEIRPVSRGPYPPLFVLGFRQGAGMAALWAARNHESVAGLVLVSGYAEPSVRALIQGEGADLRGTPCLVLIGAEAGDSIDSGDLAVVIRELGGELSLTYLDRRAAFSNEDYVLIREFIMNRVIHTQQE